MVTDVSRLRAAIFEQTGIAVDEHDPIMAVLVASAQQTEEIGARLLKRTSPIRVIAATAVAGLVFAATGAAVAWNLAQRQLETQRTEWLRQQSNPRLAALLMSEEGRAGIRLAEAGVARLLAKCNGRGSWRVQGGYCVPMRPDGRPDGFKLSKEGT